MSLKTHASVLNRSYLLIAAFIVTVVSNLAGGIGGLDGSGGKVHICRSWFLPDTAELFDFYEGRKQHGFMVILNDEPVAVQVSEAIKRLGMGRGPEFTEQLQKMANFVLASKGPSMDQVGLMPVDDSKHIILPEEGCEFEQVANYTKNNQILINQEIWDLLDNTNKAGLIVHEALYKILRTYGATDSVRVRFAVAMAFAQINTKELFADVPQDALSCHSVKDSNGSFYPGTSFYAFNDTNGNLMLYFNYIDGQLMLSRAQASPGKRSVAELLNQDIQQQTITWSNLSTNSYDRMAGIAFSLEPKEVTGTGSKRIKVGFGNPPEIPTHQVHCAPRQNLESKTIDDKE
jgi:hypothetical protein